MSGFVYIWYDRKHKRFYIGSHWGTKDDGYICSSRWMRNAYRRRPDDFTRRIIEITDNNAMLREAELKWLNMIDDCELGDRYYNLRKVVASNPRCRKTLGERISAAKKNKPVSDDHKQKISATLKGRSLSEETKRKMSISRFGKKRGSHSEETKQKISTKLKGKPLSEETKMKMSISKMGNKNAKKYWV